MVLYLTRYCNYHGTYVSVFMEISIGTGQEMQKLWHRNIPFNRFVSVMLSFSSFVFLNKTILVSMVLCTLAILIKLMEITFLHKEMSLLVP